MAKTPGMSARRESLLFAARTTLAALLAAYVAFLVPLPQASTSVLTVFIVSQPFAGMVLSKALYRILGSVVGGIVAVVLTALFSGEPVLFALAAALWIALCVYVSVTLRDVPSAYGALLSGYTVAIIAFPAVSTPDTVFLSAFDRVAEIGVGILAATLMSQVVFPRTAGRALEAAAASALAAASDWAGSTLRGRGEAPAEIARERRALVGNVARLDGLRIHATFDSPAVRRSNERIRRLHGRLVTFLALLVSVHDRLVSLRAERPERAAALQPLFDAAAVAMAEGTPAEERTGLRQDLLDVLPSLEAMRADSGEVVEHLVLLRVADLLALRGELDQLAAAGPGEAPDPAEPRATLERRRDRRLAAVAASAAFAALLVVFAFWIGTGWTSGAGAAIQVAVMASLFAQQDDPAAASVTFLAMTALSALVSAFYLFVLMPRLAGFEMLALALAPLLFGIAYVMSIPAYTLRALALGLGAISQIGLAVTMEPDFAAFANTVVASLFGLGLAALLLGVLRPIGRDWPIRRLTRAILAELADVAGRRGPSTRLGVESRMLDLVGALMTRLDLARPNELATEQGALAALRVALNAWALAPAPRRLAPRAAGAVEAVLADLAHHFRALSRGRTSAAPLPRIEEALGLALRSSGGDPSPGETPAAREASVETAVWLVALQSSLAAHPAFFGRANDAAAIPAS